MVGGKDADKNTSWVPNRQDIIWINCNPHNTDNPFAVAVGQIKVRGNPSLTSYVLCHQPKSFDWRIRQASPHPMKTLSEALFKEVCQRLNQIVQL